MDTNLYALEMLARDRLHRARLEAAVAALVRARDDAAPPAGARVRLGLLLIGVGRWLRGDGPSDGVGGERPEPRLA